MTQTNPAVTPLVWDSGKVVSNTSQNVPYGGKALPSNAAFTWTIRYWDLQGATSPWAANSTLSTGLYSAADWQNAQWIGRNSTGQLRKQFTSQNNVARATVFGRIKA